MAGVVITVVTTVTVAGTTIGRLRAVGTDVPATATIARRAAGKVVVHRTRVAGRATARRRQADGMVAVVRIRRRVDGMAAGVRRREARRMYVRRLVETSTGVRAGVTAGTNSR
jgi:hypothetical protein